MVCISIIRLRPFHLWVWVGLHQPICPHNLSWDGQLPSHSLPPPPVPPGVMGLVTPVHALFSLMTVSQTRSTVEQTDCRTLEKANGNILKLHGISFGLPFFTHVFFSRQRTLLFRGLFASASLDLASSSKSATTSQINILCYLDQTWHSRSYVIVFICTVKYL